MMDADFQPAFQSGRHDTALAHVALLVILAAFLWEFTKNTAQLDDAYISYRYAKNLAAGHGLVFNPGEYVEGITNLLWTLMVSAGVAMGFEARSVGAGLGFIFGSATLVVTYAFARRILADRLLAAVAPALVYVSTPFITWSTCGMETPLFTFAVTWSLLCAARGRFDLATLGAIVATLTRPDGVLVAGAIYLVWLIDARKKRLRGWKWPVLYAAALLALTGFRIFYYGSPVPNTFYAKVGGIPPQQGVHYVGLFVLSGAGLLLPMAVIGSLRDRCLRSSMILLLLVLVYVVAVGGDVFAESRFFVPVMPALVILALRGTELAYARRDLSGAVAAALVVLALWIQPIGTLGILVAVIVFGLSLLALFRARELWVRVVASAAFAMVVAVPLAITREAPLGGLLPPLSRGTILEEVHVWHKNAEYAGARRADKIRHLPEQPALIVVAGLGALAYHLDIPIIDVFGLVDPTIARSDTGSSKALFRVPGHQRSNADFVLIWQPDVVVISRPGEHTLGQVPAFVDLWEHPVFMSDYEYDEGLRAYRRKAFLPARNRRPLRRRIDRSAVAR